MKNTFVIRFAGLILSVLAGVQGAFADIVELPLNGSAGYYDLNTPAWTMDFDLGVTFSEISHVYIDWSGEITAELVGADPAFPINAQFVANLYEFDSYDYLGNAYIQTGSSAYPDPEPFDIQSAFTNAGWSMLLDGKGRIEICFAGIFRPAYLGTIEPPSGSLDSVTLVLDGVIPEPSTLALLGIGFSKLLIRNKKRTY